jgi:hypothetical protein
LEKVGTEGGGIGGNVIDRRRWERRIWDRRFWDKRRWTRSKWGRSEVNIKLGQEENCKVGTGRGGIGRNVIDGRWDRMGGERVTWE